MPILLELSYVCIGAALGALCRWSLSLALNNLYPLIPPGTLLVNLLGSFLMGLCLGALSNSSYFASWIKPLVLSGFMGSFTTFSTFSAEMGNLIQKGKFSWLSLGLILHVGGSICLFLFGLYLGAFLNKPAE